MNNHVDPLAAGVWGVVATPFSGESLSVDHSSLARLVRHYEAIGATGLTVLGVFGEATSLDRQERRSVLETVASSVSLPLVVGVTAMATTPAVEEVREIQAVIGDRLAGAMVQLNSADSRTLANHLGAIGAVTGVGIVAQNYPASSGVSVELASELDALRQVENLVAIKAEAAPTALRIAAICERFDVPVFGGLGGIALIDELSVGASGAMTGFSYPEGLIDTVHAYQQGGFAAAREALSPYLPLINFEQQPGIALGIRKACLVARGLIDEAGVRPPARALPDALRAQLKRHVDAVEAVRA